MHLAIEMHFPRLLGRKEVVSLGCIALFFFSLDVLHPIIHRPPCKFAGKARAGADSEARTWQEVVFSR